MLKDTDLQGVCEEAVMPGWVWVHVDYRRLSWTQALGDECLNAMVGL